MSLAKPKKNIEKLGKPKKKPKRKTEVVFVADFDILNPKKKPPKK